MALDKDFAQINWAYTWENIRYGDLGPALSSALETAEEGDDADGDTYITALGIAADVYAELGDLDKALEFSEKCFQKYQENYSELPDSEEELSVMSTAYFSLGSVYIKLFRMKEAYAIFYELYHSAFEYFSANPTVFSALKILTIACECICELTLKQEAPSMAWPFVVQYDECVTRVLTVTPDDIHSKFKKVLSGMYMGDYYFQTGQPATAIEHYSKAKEDATDLNNAFDDYAYVHTIYGSAYQKLGITYAQMEEHSKALDHFAMTRNVLTGIMKKLPGNFVFQFHLACCDQWMAISHYKQKEFKSALNFLEQSYWSAEALLNRKPDFYDLHRLQSVTFQYRGFIYVAQGKLHDAKIEYVAMYDRLKELVGQCPDSFIYKENLAHACCRFWLFLFKEMNDLRAKEYLVESCTLYKELMEEYPEIAELQTKAEMANSFLQAYEE